MTIAAVSQRKFVPQDLDVADFEQLQPLFQSLLDRDIASPADLEQWLADVSELSAVVYEYGNRRYIDKSCHTDDPEIEKAFLHFVEQVEPKIKPYSFEISKRFLSSPHRTALTDHRYEMLARQWRPHVELFREENIPLETELTRLNNEYDKLFGAMMVHFRGKEYTIQQLARFFEEPDRSTRQEAWELRTRRYLQDGEAIEQIYEKMLPIRQTIAENAGLADYREYTWKDLKRFDYTPEDCLRFADAIAEVCVPIVQELDRKRAADLGLEQLRPWDLSVDPKNRPPLRPFDESDVESFVARTQEIFGRLSPELAGQFATLRQNGTLDLASRKGKQPGGYQCSLEESRQPFIFMNAAGLQRDVETLLHEGGHAFHYIASSNEPLMFLRHAPMEFCEVASMSMEMFGADHLDVFYPDELQVARAKRKLYEGILRFFPWMAMIDSFQHWVYTHPSHTRDERQDAWLSIHRRFSGLMDWTGYEEARKNLWHSQLHLFHAPFYYVEYGIAQLGALQLWMKSREDPRRAIANYRNGLKYGGTRSLPELFAAAGITFDFSEKTIRPLIAALAEELSALPE